MQWIISKCMLFWWKLSFLIGNRGWINANNSEWVDFLWMKMMLPKIEVGLMKIMLSWNSRYIWWLFYAEDFARTNACAQTSCSSLKTSIWCCNWWWLSTSIFYNCFAVTWNRKVDVAFFTLRLEQHLNGPGLDWIRAHYHTMCSLILFFV